MRRLWTPVPYEPLVRQATKVAGVNDWTDVAPGSGRITAVATAGLSLRRRHLIIPPHQSCPELLEGWTYEHRDLREWAGTQTGDCVSLFDVLEHLVRPEAEDVLTRLEGGYRIVVIFTPLGFMRQDSTTHPEYANDPMMWHRSSVSPGDFERRGYLTYAWPLYHPGTGVGAILALRVPSLLRPVVDSSVTSCYRTVARGESTLRAVGRWVRARALEALHRRRGIL
jgi:hypothetical protein